MGMQVGCGLIIGGASGSGPETEEIVRGLPGLSCEERSFSTGTVIETNGGRIWLWCASARGDGTNRPD